MKGNRSSGPDVILDALAPHQEIALSSLLRNALSNGISAAAWRLPGQSAIQLLLTESPREFSEVQLEGLQPGFLCSRFRPELPKVFLPADFLAEWNHSELHIISGEVPQGARNKNTLTASDADNHTKATYVGEPGAASYNNLVDKCLEAIRSGKFEKLVPARCQMVQVSDEADPVKLMMRLAEAYPNAFISMVHTPGLGLWIGASPEPLISIDRERTFRTVALAGTKPYDPAVPENEVAWTQKEIEEQALVERYIISCFKTIRLREYDEFGPKTYRAGNLLHLRSVFEVNMDAVCFPDLGSVMLKLLHPTSAVCGMPGKEALEFLAREEGFDRELFAGFLGPVNIRQETHLFVNLRCLKWMGEYVQLFAGAGVTSGSSPESEFRECGLKMETILRHLPTVNTSTN